LTIRLEEQAAIAKTSTSSSIKLEEVLTKVTSLIAIAVRVSANASAAMVNRREIRQILQGKRKALLIPIAG
jgi:hypothetical protein